MNIIPTPLKDAVIIEPKVFGDARGFFMETWNQQAFEQAGLPHHFVQDNHSRSAQGILRGLHYQTEQTQGKLVRVTAGKVFDVAVDLRQSSPSFGQWFGVELSEENKRLFWVPPGFAHGFYVMSESADFIYKCTDFYAPHAEHSIRWDDPTLAIQWPIPANEMPKLSAKDANGVWFKDAELFA
ncbi:dTDP-4-dehydrorhamnose 3,5-epimerase [Thiofilum flexile]|uniref:dTDP-4-dehydrorhamnose 3,5-epimerase n=1 Tax=Thiofilum flexile TaxID=125627 RepID=UPI0003629CA7|nr:dTDP-4-dehydrorhamnose 3,5-epimerase [Thiofilum flexile]